MCALLLQTTTLGHIFHQPWRRGSLWSGTKGSSVATLATLQTGQTTGASSVRTESSFILRRPAPLIKSCWKRESVLRECSDGRKATFNRGEFLPASWHALRGSRKVGRSHLYTLMARRLPTFERRMSTIMASASSIEAAGVTENGLFTVSDTALLSMGLELSRDHKELDLDQLNSLFAKVGFPQREKAKLAKALDHTLSLLWLREARSKKLVAFARATGDAVFNAIIWDVVVDPGYQGSGLGKAIMERLMADLVGKGISNIALYAEPNVVGFYKPLGFLTDPDGIRGMAYSRKRR